MKATQSDHSRLESNAKSVLNKLKHLKKIQGFKIDFISLGEIKVTVELHSKKTATIQLRSTYGQLEVERAIQSRVPAQKSDRPQQEGVELVVA